MLIQIRQKLLFNIIARYAQQRTYSSSAVSVSEVEAETKDTTLEPIYPIIENISYRARFERKRQALYDKIKNLETVEEKQFEINMPRYYGWKSLFLKEHVVPYDALPHAQYITRTHIKEHNLPAYYNDLISNEQLDNTVNAIKNDIEDNIIFEHCHIRRRKNKIEMDTLNENNTSLEKNQDKDKIRCEGLVQRINRTMLIHLASKNPHLLNAEIDFKPRLEASWFAGGVEPPSYIKRVRKKQELGFAINEPVTLPVQYLGHPIMHLRYKHPLREIIPLSECKDPVMDVPTFNFNPRVLGYFLGRRHLTNIPGFWPGDENEFGFLSYLNCTHLQNRYKSYNDTFKALTVQAILASYSLLSSQACYQGFTTFNDITYPLTTQTVITDGQWWSFFVYQLNTTLVHSEHIDKNPKRNVCWTTEPIKLYDKIEDEKVYGLNEEVLKILIKFYTNAPEERIGVDLKPYLGKSVKVIADIEHDERRNWLERQYKHLVCNRSRHRRIPEIYDWQKIYLIRFKTRPLDKKREPWQFGIKMYKRRLDEHHPAYIPKHLRENPKKKKIGRWAKTYYP